VSGFVPFDNELVDALCRSKMSNAEFRTFMAIVRQSVGYGRATTADWCSMTRLAAATGLHRSRCHEAVKGVKAKGMVELVAVGNPHRPSEYRPVLDSALWSLDAIVPAKRTDIVPANQNDKVPAKRTDKVPADRTTQETRKKQESQKRRTGVRLYASDDDLERLAAAAPLAPSAHYAPPSSEHMDRFGPSDIWAACNRGGSVPPDLMIDLLRIVNANEARVFHALIAEPRFRNAERRFSYFMKCFDPKTGVKTEESGARKVRAAPSVKAWRTDRDFGADRMLIVNQLVRAVVESIRVNDAPADLPAHVEAELSRERPEMRPPAALMPEAVTFVLSLIEKRTA